MALLCRTDERSTQVSIMAVLIAPYLVTASRRDSSVGELFPADWSALPIAHKEVRVRTIFMLSFRCPTRDGG